MDYLSSVIGHVWSILRMLPIFDRQMLPMSYVLRRSYLNVTYAYPANILPMFLISIQFLL